MLVPNTYKLLVRCVEEGVAHGMRRAHKHTETPDESYPKQCLEDDILLEICEWFDFKQRVDNESNG